MFFMIDFYKTIYILFTTVPTLNSPMAPVEVFITYGIWLDACFSAGSVITIYAQNK